MISQVFQTSPKDWTQVPCAGTNGHLGESTRDFYRSVLGLLIEMKLPFMVGGAYAFSNYTGIVRHTKDLDIFVRPEECERILEAATSRGWHTEITFRHWLAKVWNKADDLVDVIFGSGNGICEVDQVWYDHSVPATVLDLPVRLIPCEEMIWSKGYILERNRYDGADVAHVIRAQGPQINWTRLLNRFGSHWRILFSHMVLFNFVYPGETNRIPKAVMDEMLSRMQRESERPPMSREKLCRGTLLSHTHYSKDIEDWGYKDARLPPHGHMTPEDIRQWTAAFR